MTALQASLFDRAEPAARPSIELRPYQLEACNRVDASLARVRSALLVMATGTGKTSCFSEAIRRRPGRALVLAHREELIRQAARRIGQQTGRSVSVEKAGEFGDKRSDVVVACVPSLQAGRLERWAPDHFELLVIDEAHHAIARSYRRIVDHFTGAKVLGVTATPDRGDEEAMGQVFDDVAFVYEIGDAIGDGWLCRVRAKHIHCEAVDLAGVHTVAGDLNQGELEMVMSSEAALHQVVKPTLEEAGDRPTAMFTTSVANAHRMAEIANRYRPDCARAIDGGTDSTTRRRVLADFDAGRFQFVVNVGVLTEGWDCPRVACIAMGRPTKSRALYAQMAGRGTRPFPGKADLLILDFVGNAGRHVLVGPEDILAGKYPEEVVAAAKKAIDKNPGQDISQALAEAEARIKAEREAREEAARRRAAARTNVVYRTVDVDPFRTLSIEPPRYAGRFGDGPATPGQITLLARGRVPVPQNLTRKGAMALFAEMDARKRRGLCDFAQAAALAKLGKPTDVPAHVAAKILREAR